MGDFKNMVRDLKEVRRLQREANLRSVVLEFVSWAAALGALLIVVRMFA